MLTALFYPLSWTPVIDSIQNSTEVDTDLIKAVE